MASIAAWLVPCILIVIGLAIGGYFLVKRSQNSDITSSFRNGNPFARTFSFRPKPEDSIPTNAPPTAYVPPPHAVVVEKPPAAAAGTIPPAAAAAAAAAAPGTPGSHGPPSPAVQRVLNMK